MSFPRHPFGGRHELGQNFLVDHGVVARLLDLVPPGPVLELGAGGGALTRGLAARPDPVTAVERDPHRAAALRRDLGGRVRVIEGDMLDVRPDVAHTVVSNVPFGITTALLRHLLAQQGWTRAVLLVQWEVARKRAAVGGTTLLTAAWWPWYEFAVAGRVPSAAFRPRPGVDGGVLVLDRRAQPLLPTRGQASYQAFTRAVFAADRVGTTRLPGRAGRPLARSAHAARRPRELDAAQWVGLFRSVGAGPGHRGAPDRAGRGRRPRRHDPT